MEIIIKFIQRYISCEKSVIYKKNNTLFNANLMTYCRFFVKKMDS